MAVYLELSDEPGKKVKVRQKVVNDVFAGRVSDHQQYKLPVVHEDNRKTGRHRFLSAAELRDLLFCAGL